MLYIFQDLNNLSDESFYKLKRFLSKERLHRVDKYRFMLDRKLSLIAYLILRYGLYCEYNIQAEPIFKYNEYHKPYLLGYPNIFFNLSHCKDGVICAISNKDIGCDIQDISEKSVVLSSNIFSKNELFSISTSNDIPKAFTLMWSVKESYFKLVGTGLANTINFTDFSKLQEDIPQTFNNILIYPFKCNNCYISICCEDLSFNTKPKILKCDDFLKGGYFNFEK
jgi:4'-phosphopantetheinyl transferase